MTTPNELTLRQALDRDPEYRTVAENLMADRIEELEAELKQARRAAYETPRAKDVDGSHYTPWQRILLEDLTAAERRDQGTREGAL